MASSKISGPVVGIDLGTTYSAVAVYRNGKAEIIANDQGNRTTPSVVAFTDSEYLVGEPARNQAAINPQNTVYEIKRLMGRNWSDQRVQDAIKRFPFEVVNQNDKPCVKVMYKGEQKIYTPEQISAMILEEMKKIAETYLGTKVQKVVITVPAYFSEEARQATKDAAIIAGLDCIRLLAEPTAAAIAHGFDKKYNKTGKKRLCCLDAGGGTYDISILEVEDGVFETKSVGGNCWLGGADIDNVLVEYCTEEFKKQTKLDISQDDRAKRRLRTACERAKRTLSSAFTSVIEIDSLFGGQDFNLQLSRAKFESLVMPILRKHVDLIPGPMTDAKISKSEIDEVVLVGGTTRIPKLQELFSQFFGGKKLSTDINPDEAVAIGAGIQAAVLSGIKDEAVDQFLIIDVTPLSIGIETAGGVMTPIIKRNSAIPCKKTQKFSTYADNQTSVTVKIFEGERPLTRDCHRLGTFELQGIPPAPRGVPEIEIAIDLDSNGIMEVTAIDLGSKNKESVKITNDRTRLSKEEIDRMVAEAEKNRTEDEKVRSAKEAYNKLDNNIHQATTLCDKLKESKESKEADVSSLSSKCSELRSWLANHTDEEAQVYESKLSELQEEMKRIEELIKNNSSSSNSDSKHSTKNGPKVEEVD